MQHLNQTRSMDHHAVVRLTHAGGLLPLAFAWLLANGCTSVKDQGAFPYYMPAEKPDRPLSAALERSYSRYRTTSEFDNELHTQFRYSELEGFNYNDRDGTITRRDPSNIIRANGKYYVWYTYRNTKNVPKRTERTVEDVPSRDWDLSDIWYATSEDGFTWKEEGLAVARAPKGKVGDRSIATPGMLEWQGKFYLYYQAFADTGDGKINDCVISAAYADSPDGPWTPTYKEVVHNGRKGEWDHFTIQDPTPLVHDGKIFLYYKSDFDDRLPAYLKMVGLATADNPLGPFERHPLNPVLNSGHEISLFPFEEGIAALVIRDGYEHFTIQYAPDGVNFEIETITELMPIAPGPYIPDAFTDTKDGRGITWGLCHVNHAQNVKGTQMSILLRFDCDLSKDFHDPMLKKTRHLHKPDVFLRYSLNWKQRQERMERERLELERQSE